MPQAPSDLCLSRHMPSPFNLPRLPLAGEPLPWSSDSFREFAAAASLCRLDGMTEAFARRDLLCSTWTLKEAQASNLIEGTATMFDEVVGAQAGVVPPLSRRDDVMEVLNCRNAMAEGISAVRGGTPITLSLIKDLHAMLLDGAGSREKKPGAFRNVQVHIGRPGAGIKHAFYIPPAPLHLQKLLENWLQFLARTDLNPLVQAAVMHAQFELIHPFTDGNGRMGRLLISLFLAMKGVLHTDCFFISPYLLSHRADYYAALGLISREKRWDPWISFFLTAVEEESRSNAKLLATMVGLYEESKAIFASETKEPLAIAILDYVFANPVFTLPKLHEECREHISKQGMVLLIRRLEESGAIRKIEPGRGRRPALYSFTKLLELLK